MSEPNQHEQAILDAALNLPSKDRAAYLDQTCAGDEALRRRLEARLFQAAETLPADLEQPPAAGPRGTMIVQFQPEPHGERPGDRIGRYKLLEHIAEGGMGSVWVAEREEEVRLRVALKVIKLGMDTKQVIARFEAERQALALMDHPNIAKALDAGTTETGRPYFVMELVRGIPITEYCDQNNLSTQERLDLFVQACRGIQHAHQKGVIHRDVKPSNILVTLRQGVPVPKVIDFGIAKATQGQRLTEKTLYTAFEEFIGTPAYMSPEQADRSGLGIDTRSDIYSLGVLLYELLTGQTPFDPERLSQLGPDGIRRVIKEEEPPRPSTKLGTLDAGQQATVAKRRQSEPPRLIRLVRRDLDWIVMKCLEKNRTRRYETANGLASDIERYLNSEPVKARPPSQLYRFQKMVRRNKLAFAATGGVVVALLLGIVVSGRQAVRATRAEHKARKAQAAEADQAKQIRRQLYASEMNMQLQAWKNGDLAGALATLERYQPQPGQEDLRGFEWFYLWRLCHGERLVLTNHEARVRAVSFSPDGRRLVSGGDDSKARVWDAATGRQVAELAGHSRLVGSVSFSPDGSTIATGSQDHTVRLWDAVTYQRLATFTGLANDVGALSFSPDGRWLAVGSARLVSPRGNPLARFVDVTPFGAQVKVWSVAGRREVATLSGHRAGIRSLAFSPNGKTLGSASAAGEVLLWSWPDGTERARFGPFQAPMLAVGFSPDGKYLAIGGGNPYEREAFLKVFDPATGQQFATLRGHRGAVFALAFSPNGQTLATAGIDHAIRFWDLTKGTETRAVCAHRDAIWSLAFDRTGRYLATGSWDKTVKLWEAGVCQDVRRFPDLPSYSLSFSPSGRFLACGSEDVQILKLGSDQSSYRLPEYQTGDALVAWSSKGTLLAAAGTDGRVTIWETSQWRKLGVLQGKGGRTWSRSLAFSPDGSMLASGTGDQGSGQGAVQVWDVAHRSQRWLIQTFGAYTESVVFTLDGQSVIASGGDEVVSVDVQTGNEQWRLKGTGMRLAISPDGKSVAATAGRNAPFPVRLLDLASRKVKWEVSSSHNDYIYGLAFSPDGRTLATGSWDGTAKLWDTATGHEMFRYDAPGVVWSVAFSPDGAYWAVGSSGNPGEVAILQAATRQEVASFNAGTSAPVLPPQN